ncbi:A/G-specific adenine glycosylase [Anoxybacillus flavithermus]|uniref:A/G-specific adenine glycosylase n=1 Tax=Anoxybacillus flavithermus TaxID=33934 RepID=UPI0007D98D63|nr:A/G-specific adenine glycosylase [Anoxybacillus flavithermus]
MNVKENVQQILAHFHIEQFQHDLIHWFVKEQRDLPWRKEKDPYKIWVSEVMLQQTRVDTVIPYFYKFIEKFPTLDALADAEEKEVLKAWEGLGYYSRIRNLHAAVKEVKEKYNGCVPASKEQFSSLKGVGPYTTGAVLSIAYDIPEPAVDGNVMRVLSRIFYITDDIAKGSTRKKFEQLVSCIIAHDNPSDFNQALMELGALICTPKNPSCLLCPVQRHCRAFTEGMEKQLPVKTKAKAPKHVAFRAIVLVNEDGNILIEKRPSSGLLANLWQFPNDEHAPTADDQTFIKEISERYGVVIRSVQQIGTFQHVFSHVVWHIEAYKGEAIGLTVDIPTRRWVTIEELASYAFPVVYQKIWQAYE